MSTLLLRLAAPLQSWGDESKFETRRTAPYPTKSGVVGLLAAALGISREDDDKLKELSSLKFGIRVDKEGRLLRDYHTVAAKNPYITQRFYLSDAVFLAGFESSDEELLNRLEAALKSPAYPLYLGRRSCPPTLPLVLGIHEKELYQALSEEKWQLPDWQQKNIFYENDRKLRIIIDDSSSDIIAKDLPISFSKNHRRFGWRGIRECDSVAMPSYDSDTDHDPFAELR